MEGKTRQGKGIARVESQRMGKGRGRCYGYGYMGYNGLLCAYMDIIGVYMYIYTAPWGKFFNT